MVNYLTDTPDIVKGLVLALDHAIAALTEVAEPTAETLASLGVVRSLRQGYADWLADQESDDFGSVRSKMLQAGVAPETVNKIEAKIDRLSAETGLPRSRVIHGICANVERDMRRAGMNPDEMRRKMLDAAERGDAATAARLIAEMNAALAALSR